MTSNFLNLINSGVVSDPFNFKSRSFPKISRFIFTGLSFVPRAFKRGGLPKIATRRGFKGSFNLSKGGKIGKGGIIGSRGMIGKRGGKNGGNIGNIGKRGISGGNIKGGTGLSRDRFGLGSFGADNLKGGGFGGSFGRGGNDLVIFGSPELMLMKTGESLETFLMMSGLDSRLLSPAMRPMLSPLQGIWKKK